MTTRQPQSGQQKASIDPQVKNAGRERNTPGRNDQGQQRRTGSGQQGTQRKSTISRDQGVRQPTDPQYRR